MSVMHETTITYCEWQEGGDPYKIRDKVSLCLNDISGVLPGDEKNETIIFLQGRDLIIQEDYNKFKEIWKNAKGINKTSYGQYKKTHPKKRKINHLSNNQGSPRNSSNSSDND